MEAAEAIADQVERFESFCTQKRTLEGGIELVLAKRDAKAVMEVAMAERELDSTGRECERISARVTRARQGDFGTPQRNRMTTQDLSTAFSVPAQPNGAHGTGIPNDQRSAHTTPASAPVANRQDHPADKGPSTPPRSLPHQLSSPALTNPQKAEADSQRDANYDQRIEDNPSDESITLLVQRYIDICHERQILQEEIEDRLERKERLAMEKLLGARINLESIREKAVEVVAALNEASGGDTRVRLPTATPDETQLAPPSGLDPINAHRPFTLPHASSSLSPAGGSTPTAPVPNNTFSKNATISTAAGSVLQPLPNTPRGATIDRLEDLISQLRRTPATPPPAPSPGLPSNGVTATQQAIFKRYDELMKAAKAAGATVQMPAVPWPLLVLHAHQYPMQDVMEKNLVNSSVVGFIHLYSRWKGWNLRDDGRPMREDWEKLQSVIPEHKRGGRACVAKVVSILRELVPDK